MRWLGLLLALFLWGCHPPEPPPQKAPSQVFLAVGSEAWLRMQLPPGWRQQAGAANQRVFVHSKQGRLVLQDLGPNLRQQWLEQLQKARDLLPMHPQEAEGLLSPPFLLDREADYAVLVPLLVRDVSKNPPKGRQQLGPLIDYLRSHIPSDDLVSRLQDNYQRRGYHLKGQQDRTVQGQAGLLVSFGTRQEVGQGLYFLYKGHLIAVEVHASARERGAIPNLLTGLAEAFALDVPRPQADLLQGPTPTPRVARPVGSVGGRHHRPHKASSPLGRWLGPWVPLMFFLCFTSLPAYLGARGGYRSAEMSGGDVRTGAASGAFTATFFAILACGLVALLVVWAFTLQAPGGGGGIMSLGMASVIFTVVLVFGCLAAGAVGASLAAVGAYFGAGSGGLASGLLAALLAALGVVCTPFLLKSMPGPTRRSGSSIPPVHPMAAQSLTPVQVF
jgi:hypothetical protein